MKYNANTLYLQSFPYIDFFYVVMSIPTHENAREMISRNYMEHCGGSERKELL